jgi:eukaryotic-like serine/threonine-protein kinase
MDGAEPGRLLAGRYRLELAIGHGGMGVVWRARDELLNRDVAVKELRWPPDFTEHQKEQACQRASREAKMAARLNHPNVIRVYDIVEETGHPWIVMELLPYQSLRDLVLEQGRLTPARAAGVGLGVIAALRAAHEEGIVHRDVKPANILVGPDDRVVLTDFGIARAADSSALTTVGMVIGSPSYIAPERARGGESSAPGDLWGLGATLYTAVEGHPPFERDGALESLAAVVADEPEPAGHAGPLWPVISGLLRKDPGERPDAAETERMLRRVAAAPDGPAPDGASQAEPAPAGGAPAEPAPAPFRPPEPSTASLRPRRTRRLPALAGLALLAAAVTAVALVLTGSPGRQGASPAASTHPTAPSGSHPGTGTTPAGTSRPSPSPSGTVPAGWQRFTNSTGFSIGVPQGWVISHVGHYVYIRDPGNGGIFLLIDQSDTPKPNPLADWEQQQAARRSSYPDYHLLRLEPVAYAQAEKAADWEFTYDRDGVPVHILSRNILANAHHAYALYWSTPQADWNAYHRYFQAFAATFRPAPA